ncbi:peptidoglycan-binding domain-containing protein [Marinobacter arenosus]|uniref:peptidoglycan-binding domain-containing protein n=1 Tax=Marinobacter arenosus TaxID=2856822 RepID=UPI001C4CFCEF|nr:peptidoglycan-binding domain-containing protein [Marinobacter arenosus]MBW0146168.1 peptidoglycan-binding protein [Marinobacter arenosus]
MWSCTEQRTNMFNTQPILQKAATTEGFIMNVVRSRNTQRALVISLALTASTVSHANTVNVIFSAENALYGAGYDIGRADGWMDTTLKNAIRQYQDRASHLRTSGNLDSDTLTSLGIANKAGTSISGNSVASKADALAALGISEVRPAPAAKPAPKREEIVAKAFTVPPAPEPKEQPKPEDQPEPKKVAEKPEPAPEPVSVKKPETAKSSTGVTVKATAEVEQTSVATVRVEPEAPISKSDEIKAVTSENNEESTTTDDVQVLTAEVTEQSDPSTQLPSEPTATGMTAHTPAEENAGPVLESPEHRPAATGDDRSIFGSLFDFLFGWMA